MLDKIVLAKDRKSAVVHFDTHSVLLHSDEDVMMLIYELIIQPSLNVSSSWTEKQRRYLISLEDTVEIDISILSEDVA